MGARPYSVTEQMRPPIQKSVGATSGRTDTDLRSSDSVPSVSRDGEAHRAHKNIVAPCNWFGDCGPPLMRPGPERYDRSTAAEVKRSGGGSRSFDTVEIMFEFSNALRHGVVALESLNELDGVDRHRVSALTNSVRLAHQEATAYVRRKQPGVDRLKSQVDQFRQKPDRRTEQECRCNNSHLRRAILTGATRCRLTRSAADQ